jgi:hypothetical protein
MRQKYSLLVLLALILLTISPTIQGQNLLDNCDNALYIADGRLRATNTDDLFIVFDASFSGSLEAALTANGQVLASVDGVMGVTDEVGNICISALAFQGVWEALEVDAYIQALESGNNPAQIMDNGDELPSELVEEFFIGGPYVIEVLTPFCIGQVDCSAILVFVDTSGQEGNPSGTVDIHQYRAQGDDFVLLNSFTPEAAESVRWVEITTTNYVEGVLQVTFEVATPD